MRRTVLAGIAGGAMLLSTSACGGVTTTDVVTPAAPTTAVSASSAPDYTADTSKICGVIEKLLEGKELEKFGKELGKLIIYKESKLTAKANKARTDAGTKLKALATVLRDSTAAAKDPDLRAAGEESAGSMVASAGNDAFFSKIKTEKDLDTALNAEITAWLTPVMTICA